jgi:hypothetical protein
MQAMDPRKRPMAIAHSEKKKTVSLVCVCFIFVSPWTGQAAACPVHTEESDHCPEEEAGIYMMGIVFKMMIAKITRKARMTKNSIISPPHGPEPEPT